MKIATSELEGKALPPVFTNVVRRKNNTECQTLELMKRNQKVCRFLELCSSSANPLKINVSHQEVVLMSMGEIIRISICVITKINR